jgi:hypothetical protein
VGQLVGISPLAALWAFVWSATAGCAAVLTFKSSSIVGTRAGPRAAAAFVALTLFVAAVGNLGQREHLFVLLFLPYVVHRLRVAEGTHASLAAWTGTAGAIGVCIKPHFLLIAAVLEGVVLLRAKRRSLEPGFALFALTGLTYGAHFLLLPEEVRHALFDTWLPELANGYRAYGAPWVAFQTLLPVWGTVLALALAALAGRGRMLGLLALAALTVYFVQWKGWFYHLIPALLFAGSAFAASVGPWLTPLLMQASRVTAAFLGGLILVLLVRGNAVPDGGEARLLLERELSAGDTVVYIGSDLTPAYPWLPLHGVRNIARYPVTFPLVVLWPDGHPAPFGPPASEADASFRRDLAADLDGRADWVVLSTESPCTHCGEGVDVPRFLAETGMTPTLESRYHLHAELPTLQIWARR